MSDGREEAAQPERKVEKFLTFFKPALLASQPGLLGHWPSTPVNFFSRKEEEGRPGFLCEPSVVRHKHKSNYILNYSVAKTKKKKSQRTCAH